MIVLYQIWLFFFGSAFYMVNGDTKSAPTVSLKLGRAVGIKATTWDFLDYFSYRGIPYAKPPTGSRRFAPPEPNIEPWQGERFFQEYRNHCLGMDHYQHENIPGCIEHKYYAITGSEDCLYLNVHTKEIHRSPVPVIFFMHGGFFSFSDPERYGPDYLMHRKVVYVNFSYRVGPFGFLSTGDEACPGNMGLKDQSLALNWVKTNIAAFGGDPNKITIAGVDAGAASVHFIGTAFSPWAFSKLETIRDKTIAMARDLNCLQTDMGDLIRCLRARPADDIMQTQVKAKIFLYLPFTKFTPVDDSRFWNGYFVQHPNTMIKDKTAKKATWITGFTSDNGLYPTAEFLGHPELVNVVKSKWPEILPALLSYNKACRDIASIISATEYSSTEENHLDLVAFVNDRNFLTPAINSALEMNARPEGDVYVYKFAHKGRYSLATELSSEIESHDFLLHASHGDDVAYIFKRDNFKVSEGAGDQRISANLIDILLSYADTGKPPASLSWPPLDKKAPQQPGFTIYEVRLQTSLAHAILSRQGKFLEYDPLFQEEECIL